MSATSAHVAPRAAVRAAAVRATAVRAIAVRAIAVRAIAGRAIAGRRLPVAVTVLATATGLVHLGLGALTTVMIVTDPALVAGLGGATMLGVMAGLFYLSFLGYLAFNLALYRPRFRRCHRLARWALGAWAAGNIAAYAVLAQGHVDAFGVADKICEALLITLLVIEGRRARR
jgi:hypothetical protein